MIENRLSASCSSRDLALIAFVSLGLIAGSHAADPFAEFVRSTDPRAPEEELKTFHLPEGFEIQLVAAEPDIGKPMNMAFDGEGRLWISQSREYPYPAPSDRKGRDAIKILSDFSEAGRARKIVAFAEELNIPIGLYPYKGGVIGLSIPNVYHFQDTDGDGRADRRHVVLGRFGFEKDTHGLTSAFRRGYDGWLYADHGFNNDSTLTARDGSTIKLNSGNTYRAKVDGSRVEQFTWGQVNPFGLMFDERGDLWSADCHSSPVYLLLRGAYYPSFGKPDDGLGVGPAVMRHSHGSTAISGIVVYNAEDFPKEYHGNTFVGNVMTCRINRDSYTWNGSTPTANEEDDFVRSDDPWFRPVDLQLGPDGALYIADFYNRIIGHYEVPLDHPGRDRERGRIWRVVYRGTQSTPAPQAKDLSRAALEELWRALADPNITVRMLATSQITDRLGDAATTRLKELLTAATNRFQKIHGLWALYQLGALNEEQLQSAANDAAALVRVHAMRVLSETANWSPAHRRLALAGTEDSDAFVRRAAADALGQHPDTAHIEPLLKLRKNTDAQDANLVHTVRMALRNNLKPAESFRQIEASKLTDEEARRIADVAAAVPSAEAGRFLLKHVQKSSEDKPTMSRYLRHVAQYVGTEQLDELAQFLRKRFAEDLELQLALFKSIQSGAEKRDAKLPAEAHRWGAELAGRLLSADSGDSEWGNSPLDGATDPKSPWFTQRRASSDGEKGSRFWCSLPPGGEQLTGTLRSKTFEIPEKLEFFLAGHDGFPDKPAQKKNVVRLRDAETRAVLAEKFPPRNDTAQPVKWDLAQHTGRRGYLEVTDGDTGAAYAWLAIGRIRPSVVAVPATDPKTTAERQQAGADLARTLMLRDLADALEKLLLSSSTDIQTRAAAAGGLVAFQPDEVLSALAPAVADPALSGDQREKICKLVAKPDIAGRESTLIDVLRVAPRRLQNSIAQALAGSATGAAELLKLVSDNKVSASLLADRGVREKIRVAGAAESVALLENLIRDLPPQNEVIDKLVSKRRKNYVPSKASASDGAPLFAQHCAACHQIGGVGAIVGPQLDGVGNRGIERLCEDVLDPNRSVDPAFKTTLVVLKDGDVVSGLLRREETELIILADSAGKEVSVPKKDVAERRPSHSSLMPENFGELLSEEQFNNLMAFLLSK